jgi:hypothetical protein
LTITRNKIVKQFSKFFPDYLSSKYEELGLFLSQS